MSSSSGRETSKRSLFHKLIIPREAPWSSGERQGLTIRAMVLGRGFESWLHLKTRWRWTTRWQKNTENNKDSQMGQVTSKKNKKKIKNSSYMLILIQNISYDPFRFNIKAQRVTTRPRWGGPDPEQEQADEKEEISKQPRKHSSQRPTTTRWLLQNWNVPTTCLLHVRKLC